MPALRAELDELVAAARADLADGESLADRAHQIAREALDVLGAIVNLDGDQASRDAAASELEAALSLVVERLLAENPFVKRAAKAALPFLVPNLVDELADYAGSVDEWLEENVLPILARWEETIHRARVAIA